MATLKVYSGCMFAQKTTGLLTECGSAIEEKVRVLAFKPVVDTRYVANDIVSHDGIHASDLGVVVRVKPKSWVPSEKELSEIVLDDYGLIAIDESQFFTHIDKVVVSLLSRGLNVVCAGLDMDSNGNVFGKMGTVLAYADTIYKPKADCAVCCQPASRTFKKLTAPSHTGQILVGGKDIYEPRCYRCWEVGVQEKETWTQK